MFFAYLNAAIGLLVIFGVFALAWGYSTGLDSPNSPTRRFALSYAFLTAGAVGRVAFWDLIIYPTSYASYPLWGVIANTGFGLCFLVSIYLGLQARRDLIPPEDRDRFHWWDAWRYPPRRRRR